MIDTHTHSVSHMRKCNTWQHDSTCHTSLFPHHHHCLCIPMCPTHHQEVRPGCWDTRWVGPPFSSYNPTLHTPCQPLLLQMRPSSPMNMTTSTTVDPECKISDPTPSLHHWMWMSVERCNSKPPTSWKTYSISHVTSWPYASPDEATLPQNPSPSNPLSQPSPATLVCHVINASQGKEPLEEYTALWMLRMVVRTSRYSQLAKDCWGVVFPVPTSLPSCNYMLY